LTGAVISAEVFRDLPVLTGPRVRLEPMGSQHFDGLRPMADDPEGRRLTGTHATFTEDVLRRWVATRAGHHDRADWAIVRRSGDLVLGEAVLNDLSPDNESVNFRIALIGPGVFGQGYGTEATALVVGHAFAAGLHRVELEVYDFNPRAHRVYEKCGFQLEGRRRDALRWDGEWHDALVMSILATDPRPAGPGR
jgi:RimJ/RimL family protein N-acetyltransferase